MIVSIITMTYKDFSGLFNTIRSVLEQDWPEFEYIISDDGSGNFPKQAVIDFIELYKRENLKSYQVLDNKENVGTVKHLNRIIKLCNGEYIFDLSCNDLYVDQHTVSNIVNAFEQEKCDVLIVSRLDYHNKSIKAICPHIYDRKRMNRLDTKEKRLSAFLMTEHCDMFIAPNVFYKKSVIERNGYHDESYRLFEDAPMIAKFLLNERVSIRPDLYAVLYECKNGVSAPKSKNAILANDIKRFNSVGKMEYYEHVSKKARYHIRYGVERSKAKNLFEYVFVNIKYSPRIIGYLLYCLGRRINSVGDRRVLKEIHSSFL